MTVRKLKLTHPGKILREQFMRPLGLSAHSLAKALEVRSSRVNLVARGKCRISPEMAVLLSAYFQTSESYWINLQSHYDLEVAKNRLSKHAARIVPHPRETASERQGKGNPPDSKIDTMDIPPLGEEFFREAVRNPFYRRIK